MHQEKRTHALVVAATYDASFSLPLIFRHDTPARTRLLPLILTRILSVLVLTVVVLMGVGSNLRRSVMLGTEHHGSCGPSDSAPHC